KSITSCDWALREGVILDYLSKNPPVEYAISQASVTGGYDASGGAAQALDSHSVPEERKSLNVRMRSVLSVARRYDYDARHAHHIGAWAVKIFDEPRAILGMGDRERKFRESASLLHDMVYHIPQKTPPRHSLYLIKTSELPGFTGEETAIMATV